MNTSWLKTRRKQLKLSQEDLAARLSLQGFVYTAGAISHWETGLYNPPLDKVDFRQALAQVLKVDVRTLLMMAGYEVREAYHSELAVRAADIVNQLPPDKQELAVGILEKFLETA